MFEYWEAVDSVEVSLPSSEIQIMPSSEAQPSCSHQLGNQLTQVDQAGSQPVLSSPKLVANLFLVLP